MSDENGDRGEVAEAWNGATMTIPFVVTGGTLAWRIPCQRAGCDGYRPGTLDLVWICRRVPWGDFAVGFLKGIGVGHMVPDKVIRAGTPGARTMGRKMQDKATEMGWDEPQELTIPWLPIYCDDCHQNIDPKGTP